MGSPLHAPPPERNDAPRRCPDCDHPAPERFCPHCGQRQGPLHVSLLELAADWMEEFLHFDGKLVHTLWPLLVRPGFLTREYVVGRRTRYLKPFRVWLAVTVAYFLLLALVPTRIATGQVHIEHGKGPPPKAAVTPAPAAGSTLGARIQADLERRMDRLQTEDPGQFSKTLQRTSANDGPHLALLLVPMFALLLKLFYWRAPLGEHFVFSFHLNAFFELWGMVTMLAACIPAVRARVPDAALLSFLALAIYIPVAIRRVHRAGVVGMVLKSFALFVGFLMGWGLLQSAFVLLALGPT